MIRAGFTIDNPVTRARTIVLKSEVETKGTGWVVETHTPPHAPPDLPEHLHLGSTETFEIIAGRACYQVDGVRHTVAAGNTIVLPPRRRHIHPWNIGETELVCRQLNVFDRRNPRAVQDVLGLLATSAGLARDGKVDQRGQPKDPLQLAVMLKTLNRCGGYDAKLPIPVQRLLGTTLGSLAEALGYRAIYPQYVGGQPVT